MGANVEVMAAWLRMKLGEAAHEEEGGGEIIATVVVIAIVVALGVLFHDRIGEFFNTLWGQATGNVGGATASYGK